MKITKRDILALRRLLEAFVAQADDATASIAPKFSPTLPHDGGLVRAGTRVNVDGIIWKATVDLWDTEENSPENDPTLWEKLAYRDGYRIIPETITVTGAFAKGERGWWGDVLMESVVDSNVYTPEQYAANWITVGEEVE